MFMSAVSPYSIVAINSDQFGAVGALLVESYLSLPGMPAKDEQPEFYDMMSWVALRRVTPSVEIYVALSGAGEIVGTIDFIGDMKHYGAVTRAVSLTDAAAIRHLAVAPDYRGIGVGRSLTQFCLERAVALGKSQVVLHTGRPMRAAWSMYERMGFMRLREIDFWQRQLQMLGFSLALKSGSGIGHLRLR